MRSLFDTDVPVIEGFRYQREFISRDEEAALLREIERLRFGTVVFRGYEARRRVVQFGWDYSFDTRRARPAMPLPAFLAPLQQRAGTLIGLEAHRLEEALITEYQPGAAMGWHRDAPPFGIVIGISLLSAVKMNLKPMRGGRKDLVSIELEPRSVYVFDGPARAEWQHSIPVVKALRYSITFRTIRENRRHASR